MAFLKRFSKAYLPILVLALVVAALPWLLADNYQLKIATFVAINGILVMGLCLLIGYAGQISLGHAAFYGLGAYSSAILTTTYGLPVWFGFLVSIVLTTVVAFAIASPSLKLRGHYLAMATLGFGEIMYILFVELGDLTGGPSGLPGIPPLKFGNFVIDTALGYYYAIWLTAIILLIISVNIINSRVGRALRAMHGSESAAQAMGVNVSSYKIQIFLLSAVYASLAGSFYAHFVNFVNPSTFTLTSSVVLVTMVVVGGMTSIWGALLGAALLTALPEYLRFFKQYDLVIYAAILIGVMNLMPQGLLPGTLGFIKSWRVRLFPKARKVQPGTETTG